MEAAEDADTPDVDMDVDVEVDGDVAKDTTTMV